METQFLDLVPVINTTTTQDLFEVVLSSLNSHGLDLRNCIGFGSDGASVIIRENNSLWSRLRIRNAEMIQVNQILIPIFLK